MSEAESHWRLLFQHDFLCAADLRDKDATLTITAIASENLPQAGTSETVDRPVMTFAETRKKLVLNKTNSKSIAKMLGVLTAKWVGKRITIYPTTTKFGRETVECIRVRETAQKGAKE